MEQSVSSFLGVSGVFWKLGPSIHFIWLQHGNVSHVGLDYLAKFPLWVLNRLHHNKLLV